MEIFEFDYFTSFVFIHAEWNVTKSVVPSSGSNAPAVPEPEEDNTTRNTIIGVTVGLVVITVVTAIATVGYIGFLVGLWWYGS